MVKNVYDCLYYISLAKKKYKNNFNHIAYTFYYFIKSGLTIIQNDFLNFDDII